MGREMDAMVAETAARELHYEVTEADYKRFAPYVILRRTRFQWLWQGLLYVLWFGMATYFAWQTAASFRAGSGDLSNLFSFVFYCCVRMSLIWEWFGPSVAARKRPGALGQCSVRATDRYVEVANSATTSRFEWSSIKRVGFGNELIMLFTSDREAEIIPTRAFSSLDDARNYSVMLEQNVSRVGTARVDDNLAATSGMWPPAPKFDDIGLTESLALRDPGHVVTLTYSSKESDIDAAKSVAPIAAIIFAIAIGCFVNVVFGMMSTSPTSHVLYMSPLAIVSLILLIPIMVAVIRSNADRIEGKTTVFSTNFAVFIVSTSSSETSYRMNSMDVVH